MTRTHTIGPLFTDFYELTMAASYFDHHVFDSATFSVFIRNQPMLRSYFVAAGLEQVVDELNNFHFNDCEIAYLKETDLFSADFLSYLTDLRFTGQLRAMAEGTIFFPNEPILEISAPIIEAQLLETFILNTIGFQTMIATKAARCIHAAKGRPLLDFSLRRTQGQDAGNKVARSTYLAGFNSTSNVLAGKLYDIPLSGTMAHSFVTAFESEIDAFQAFYKTFPDASVFLIDTYDTLEGARNAARVAKHMQQHGHHLIGVRLDSGDMTELSQQVRAILDEEGLPNVKIFVSSGFDEFKITDVLARGARIDAFGVGTKMGVSADAPYLDIVYKMVRYKDRNVRKLSSEKITLAGEKQLFRKYDPNGFYAEDTIGLRDDIIEGTEPLLETIMENGKIVAPIPPLQTIRGRFKQNFSKLDDRFKTCKKVYPVHLSTRLKRLQDIV
ncbi:MAG: nicotinate phosphoribosyltransferase [Desulfobacterales bacterium]|nr:nicotinate phosphoribosyltransferase [Desulfobacterales bacterium]MDD4072606.1 nicotinate phosphoribosyltransferase [Desulfobacterales bacterium]MDD4392360.1 nicotinate phosphoribosyltransferase [Desulfobacterales bacterium]